MPSSAASAANAAVRVWVAALPGYGGPAPGHGGLIIDACADDDCADDTRGESKGSFCGVADPGRGSPSRGDPIGGGLVAPLSGAKAAISQGLTCDHFSS
jgi:hypothetical protein